MVESRNLELMYHDVTSGSRCHISVDITISARKTRLRSIDHFRISLSLYFKASVSAKFFFGMLVKCYYE